jgi:hypothetical protein
VKFFGGLRRDEFRVQKSDPKTFVSVASKQCPILRINGSYVMSTLPPHGGNINGKSREAEAIVPVPKWCGSCTGAVHACSV